MKRIIHKLEVYIAKHIKGGLVNVYYYEKCCKKQFALAAYVLMLFVPVGIIALVEFLN